jgi:hypothetical protein
MDVTAPFVKGLFDRVCHPRFKGLIAGASGQPINEDQQSLACTADLKASSR